MRRLTLGSLFAGVGGFDLGFHRAGFSVRWQVEQDGKAQSVLSARFPDVALYDDVRTVGAGSLEPVDVICGGFPCQDVSVAGKRTGLGGERTGLFWEVVRIARELQPRWMVLENVPGLLSSHGGRDFHAVLAALADCGFRRAYRILDSRYFGVAQRRRRVFLVLRARSVGLGAEAVLFEQPGSGRDTPAGGEARADVAATLRGRSHGVGVNMPGRGGEDDQNLVYGHIPAIAACLNPGHEAKHSYAGDGGTLNIVAVGVHANQRGELRTSPLAGSLNGSRSGKQFEGVFASSGERARALTSSMHKRHDEDTDTLICATETGKGWWTEGLPAVRAQGGGTPQQLIATALSASLGHHGHSSPRGDGSDNLIPTLDTSLGHHRGSVGVGDFCVAATLQGYSGRNQIEADYLPQPAGVRRLTPLECERLQGFPDGWTCLCGEGHRGSQFCTCADSPRYRQLGNAVTVNVAEWIARRLLDAEAQAVLEARGPVCRESGS